MTETRKREIGLDDPCVVSRKKQKVVFYPFETVPVEILVMILAYVPCFCNLALRLVCRLWGETAKHHHRTPDWLGYQYHKRGDVFDEDVLYGGVSQETIRKSTAGLAPFQTKDLRQDYGHLISWARRKENGFGLAEIDALFVHAVGRARLEDVQWLCFLRFPRFLMGGSFFRSKKKKRALTTRIEPEANVAAYSHGRLETLRWLINHGYPTLSLNCIDCMIQYGHAHLIRNVDHVRFKLGREPSRYRFDDTWKHAIIGAILNGHDETITLVLLISRPKIGTWMKRILKWGAHLGCIQAIEWVHDRLADEDWPISRDIQTKEALELYHAGIEIKALERYVLEIGPMGRIEQRDWERSILRKDGSSLIHKAVERGHFECAKKIYTMLEPTADLKYSLSLVCVEVARRGSLETLKWFRERGYPWSALVTAKAAENNDLEMLAWARERGCPWDRRVYKYAGEYANKKMLRYALDNDCPGENQ